MTSTRFHVTNPTRITAIPASLVEIVTHGEGASEHIRVTIRALADHVEKPDARVWLYAGAGNTSKLFDFGAVDAIQPPDDLTLAGLDAEKPRTFRLIVWDPNTKQIVASNEHIRLRNEHENGVEPLLPVRPQPLGGEVWRMALHEDAAPELLVNQDIPDIKSHLRNRPELYGCIVPEAVRQSLLHVISSQFDPTDDSAWQAKWVRFTRMLGHQLPDDPKDLNSDEARDWVTSVVREFARGKDFAKRVAKVLGGESV